MAIFDTIAADVASRFGLGESAISLVREVLNLITSTPGGFSGFLDKLRSAGFGPQLASWLGRTDPAPISAQEVDGVVGPAAVSAIATKLGLEASTVSSAVGYLLPKLIGALTPHGAIPLNFPPEITRFLSLDATQTVEPAVAKSVEVAHDKPKRVFRLLPLLGAIAVVAFLIYLFSGNTPTPTPTTSVAVAPAVPPAPGAAPPVAPALPPRLALSDENGVIHYTGAVHDAATRSSIIDALNTVFGGGNIQGDINIDPDRGSAPWLQNIRTALEDLKVPGMHAVFEGNSFNLGGAGDADREKIVSAFKTLFGGLSFGTLPGKVAELRNDVGDKASGVGDRFNDLVSSANSKVVAALTSLKPGFAANDLIGALNSSIVNFATGKSDVPPTSAALLQDAAGLFKELPPGTLIEIAGYTDNTGDAAANVVLSQQRADAIRNALIQSGVDPVLLVAKGYGSADPTASNDNEDGRFHNRRIEYHVIK